MPGLLAGGEVERRRLLALRQGEGAARMFGREARPRLDGQLVQGEMVGGQGERLAQLGAPLGLLLARAGITQYELRWRWAFRWQLVLLKP